jgi:SAM-dependent methyltransferase
MERNVYQRLDQLEGKHWWFCARRKILNSVILKFAPKNTQLRVLEAGCGTGGNLQMLSKFGNLQAFEMDEEARDIAKTKLAIDVKEGMLPDNAPHAPHSFDLVVAFDVLEHVEQDVESLATLRNQLVPGGRLIMTVPAMPWLWSNHDASHHHFRRYTSKQLKEKLLKAGLEPVRVSYFNTLLFPAIAGLRLVRKIFGIQEAADDQMPSSRMNAILKSIFGFESNFIGSIPMPFGVSLLAVAQRAR